MVTVKASPLRAIGPQRAADRAHEAIGHRAFPFFIERAVKAVWSQLVENRRGELYDALAGVRADRKRALRREARENLATQLTALIYGMEADSLFVRAPRANGPAERYSWAVYDWRAFGEQVPMERSIKRTYRGSRTLQAAQCFEVRELAEVVNDDYRSLVAHKRITAELIRMLGLLKAWQHLRRERQKERAETQKRRMEQLAGRALTGAARGKPPAPAIRAAATTLPARPESTAGPPPKPDGQSPAAIAARAEIAALLGLKKQSG